MLCTHLVRNETKNVKQSECNGTRWTLPVILLFISFRCIRFLFLWNYFHHVFISHFFFKCHISKENSFHASELKRILSFVGHHTWAYHHHHRHQYRILLAKFGKTSAYHIVTVFYLIFLCWTFTMCFRHAVLWRVAMQFALSLLLFLFFFGWSKQGNTQIKSNENWTSPTTITSFIISNTTSHCTFNLLLE